MPSIYWDHLRRAFPYNDRIFFVLIVSIVHSGLFLVLNSILWLIYHNNWFQKHRIQKAAFPDGALLRECLVHTVINHAIINPFIAYAIFPFAVHFDAFAIHTPVPGLYVLARDVLLCIVLEDTLFYWTHRLLHHPSIYKYIHKQHHRFKVNVGIASEYAHPVEALASNFIPFFAGPLLLRIHLFTFLIWAIIRVAETVSAHSGFSFPWVVFNWFERIQGGAERHDFHHSHNIGCYGSFTKFWDWAMGTDRQFRKYKDSISLKSGRPNLENTFADSRPSSCRSAIVTAVPLRISPRSRRSASDRN